MYPGSRQGTVHLSNPAVNGYQLLENWGATPSTTSPPSSLQVRDGGDHSTPTSISFPTVTISPASSTPNVGHTRTHVAVIAGSLAGVIVVLAILLTVFIVRRRQRQSRIEPIIIVKPGSSSSNDMRFVPHPFAHNPVLSHVQQYDPPSSTGSEVPQLSHESIGYTSPSHRGSFPDVPSTPSSGFIPRSPYAEKEIPYPQPKHTDISYVYPSPPQSYNPNYSISSSPSQSHGINLSFSSTTSPLPSTGSPQHVNTSQYTDDSKTALLNTTTPDTMPPSPQYSPSLFPSPFPPPSSHVPQSQASIALVSGIPPSNSKRDSTLYPPSPHPALGALTARARAAIAHTPAKSQPPPTSSLPALPASDDQTSHTIPASTSAGLGEIDIPACLAEAPCLTGVPENQRQTVAQAMQSLLARLKDEEEQDPGRAVVVELQGQIEALRRENEELRITGGTDAPPAYM